MKLILKILTVVIFSAMMLQTSNAGWADILDGSKPKINLDCANEECSLKTGTDLVRDTLHDIEKDKPFSEYLQDIIYYVLSFVSFIALVYISYAGFKILISGGEEDENKKAKGIIKAVIIGIILIWLAYPITTFIISALTATPIQ